MLTRNSLMAIALPFLSWKAHAQSDLRPFVGAGFGMENRIGFRGASVSGGISFPFSDHLSGIGQLDFFHGNHVSGWNDVMNRRARYDQLMASVRLGYNTGAVAGTGLLMQAGLAVRGGSTYHFDYGNVHEGVVTDAHYTTEKVRGNGFIIGMGYGFMINDRLNARVELTDQAMLRINDMYTLSFTIGF